MATAGDLINASLREIGVLAGGETPPADDSTDARTALNRLINQWSAEGLKLFTVTRTTWTITANDGQYTVGASADVNVSRPAIINRVGFIDTSTSPDTEYPLRKLTEDSWANVSLKAQTSTFPEVFYYNPTYPPGTLDLWPVPTSTTLSGVLYAPAVLTEFSGLTTSVSLPNGYERMIVKNLALDLCPSYGKQPSPLLLQQARDATATVQRMNYRLSDLSLDPAALVGVDQGGRYDINRG